VITIVLVEHPPAVLRALRESLSREAGLRIAGGATTVERGLGLAGRLKPDIVVLDAEMAGMNLMSAIAAFREQVPHSALVVLSIEPDRLSGIETIDVVGKVDGASALHDAIVAIGRRHSG
jgi:DNA-binding NarL/FixJ family response regulator